MRTEGHQAAAEAGGVALSAREEGFLDSGVADAISAALFAAAGAALAWMVIPVESGEVAFGLLLGCLGFLGNGIEAGAQRELSLARRAAAACAALAAHLAVWAWLDDPALWATAVRAVGVLGVGLTLPAWARRFDRGEAGWRAAVRQGDPDGTAPAARAIARARLPLPLELVFGLVGLPLRLACVGAIGLYQLSVSRLMPPACRFEPSCSRYGFHAYLRHGVLRGSLLTALRLVRCSPVSDGGFDPVPPRCARGGAEVS